MHDDKAVELYRLMRQAANDLKPKPEVARYFDLPEVDDLWGPHAGYVSAAQQHLRDIANFVNEYVVNFHDLRTWETLLPGIDEDEHMGVLMEFVNPAAYLCLGFPYALKSRAHYSIAAVSHLANEFRDSEWQYIDDLGKSSYETAREQAGAWASWSSLRHALGRVNNRPFRLATTNFRNEYHHGSPKRLEVGVKPFMHRTPSSNGGWGWALGATPPLRLADLLAPLGDQHRAAINLNEKFIELVEEQLDVVMANKRINLTRATAVWM